MIKYIFHDSAARFFFDRSCCLIFFTIKLFSVHFLGNCGRFQVVIWAGGGGRETERDLTAKELAFCLKTKDANDRSRLAR